VPCFCRGDAFAGGGGDGNASQCTPHLCSTESGSPSKGKSYTGLGKKCRLMKTVQTMKGRGNYQNCPVMRPHTPHSSYGTHVTLAPKVLVFPVFVQVS